MLCFCRLLAPPCWSAPLLSSSCSWSQFSPTVTSTRTCSRCCSASPQVDCWVTPSFTWFHTRWVDASSAHRTIQSFCVDFKRCEKIWFSCFFHRHMHDTWEPVTHYCCLGKDQSTHQCAIKDAPDKKPYWNTSTLSCFPSFDFHVMHLSKLTCASPSAHWWQAGGARLLTG